MVHVKLLSPFPGKLNPFLQLAEDSTALWMSRYGLLPTDRERRMNGEGNFTWMVARMFPHADLERLCVASDFNALLFLLDDDFDGHQTKGMKSRMFKGMVNSMISIMENTAAPVDSAVLTGFADIWHRLMAISTQVWQHRFKASLKAALQANLWRMEIVDRDVSPDLSEYLKFRPMIGGANFFAYLLLVMEQIDLPDYVYENCTMQRLMHLAASTICWANDIFSFRKELAEGDELNLVMLLRRERGGSIKEAVHAAVRFHDKWVKEFIQLGWNPPVFGDTLVDAEVVRFTQGLGVMMNANIVWSTVDTQRYRFVPLLNRPVVRIR
ncbi:hypothetical protein EGT74_06645 [Chitinophaga lutea]|uniref:Terpene synthase n=1 Tax=Chitinophaga lutea TaxID=2488634 RepID=A0A3N4QNC9_9BACT|nr:terpene synthase family protein [Chitinophaga lutea]RPE13204.1 hypothetical protein EGT74_06645 [Chitinophaga lutea]